MEDWRALFRGLSQPQPRRGYCCAACLSYKIAYVAVRRDSHKKSYRTGFGAGRGMVSEATEGPGREERRKLCRAMNPRLKSGAMLLTLRRRPAGGCHQSQRRGMTCFLSCFCVASKPCAASSAFLPWRPRVFDLAFRGGPPSAGGEAHSCGDGVDRVQEARH